MATDVKQLFDSGNLAGAIDALTQDLKAHPADAARRTFLFELLSFAGQWDRAAKQLDVIAHQNVESELGAQVYQNLLHAEGLRARVFTQGLKPEFLLDPPAYVELHLAALNCLRENRPGDAESLLDQSLEARPTLRGQIGEEPFEEFFDCDDVLAPVLELMLIRDYIWLPLEQVQELEISRPERPRDLLWAPVRVVLTDGTQRRAYMPTRYFGSHEHPDDQVKLGRMTDWRASEGGPVQGVGQRQFLAGENAFAALELPNVTLLH
jgi:type VI secretion system protein ImpE